MTIRLHRGDLPDLSRYTGAVAIDTETMGLEPVRDRLCVVQLSPGDGSADVVQIGREIGPAPNLKRLLADASKLKIFHFARFDIAMLYKALGVMPQPVYCTKIASRLTRTYTDKHGLKDLTKECSARMSPSSSSVRLGRRDPDRGAGRLRGRRRAQPARLKEKLDAMLAREGRDGTRRRLLRVPADPRPARPRRLGRGGHFRAFLNVSAGHEKSRPVKALSPRRGHIRRRFSQPGAV